MIKHCRWCGLDKPIEEFFKHKAMLDGHLNKCKSCCNSYSKKYRQANIEEIRHYDRLRGNRQSSEYVKGYRSKNPLKYKATNMVNNAIRDGKLLKQSCEVCGSNNKIHAHHDDYTKPLEVRWLCPTHHRQWHIENGEAKGM